LFCVDFKETAVLHNLLPVGGSQPY
jgi:hypothetical protein